MNLADINRRTESILSHISAKYTSLTPEQQLLLCGWAGVNFLRTQIDKKGKDAYALMIVVEMIYTGLLDDEELAQYLADKATKRMELRKKGMLLEQEQKDGIQEGTPEGTEAPALPHEAPNSSADRGTDPSRDEAQAS